MNKEIISLLIDTLLPKVKLGVVTTPYVKSGRTGLFCKKCRPSRSRAAQLSSVHRCEICNSLLQVTNPSWITVNTYIPKLSIFDEDERNYIVYIILVFLQEVTSKYESYSYNYIYYISEHLQNISKFICPDFPIEFLI